MNNVLDAVTNINQRIFEALKAHKLEDGPDIYLEYGSTGTTEYVTLAGGPVLWSEDGDGFPWSEDGNTELPFEPYLTKLLMDYFSVASKILL